MFAFLTGLNLKTIGYAAAAIAFVGIVSGAYFKGRHDANLVNELRQAEALAQAQEEARQTEQALNAQMQGVSNDYEKKLAKVNADRDAALADLGRMRIKVNCNRLPKTASAPRGSDAAAKGSADGDRTREVDLTRFAERTLGLGRDLDACNQQVIGLQGVVETYAGDSQK